MKPIFIIIIIVAVVGIAIGGYFYVTRDQESDYSFIIAEKNTLVQEVNVTGKVKPAEDVDLAFENGGKVARIYFKIGGKVNSGETLITLQNQELSAQLLQAQANLEAEQAKLAELEQGTRPEEIWSAETKVANAKISLQDKETNLDKVKQKADADLQEDYQSALTAIQQAVVLGKNALLTLSDIQGDNFSGYDQYGSDIAEAKELAVYALLGASNTGRWNGEFISTLTGGAFGTVQKAINQPTDANVDQALIATLDALQKVKTALDTVPITSDLSSTEKTSLTTEQDNIAAEITTVSNKIQAVTTQKATNQNNIITAETEVNSANNTLASAEDDLRLKKAGSIKEQIAFQEAKVKSAQANVQNYQAQIAKTILKSPIDGIITKQEANVGEIVSANTAIVSVISVANFEIEANIPEVDIAKIKINDSAEVTLDAYGQEIIFQVRVIAIDPAETMIEGVSTYKTTFQFSEENELIKSGMTADVNILTAERQEVIAIPQRAILTKDGQKIVKILTSNEQIQEIVVTTGLRSSDGQIEITSGINEGDEVIIFVKEK